MSDLLVAFLSAIIVVVGLTMLPMLFVKIITWFKTPVKKEFTPTCGTKVKTGGVASCSTKPSVDDTYVKDVGIPNSYESADSNNFGSGCDDSGDDDW